MEKIAVITLVHVRNIGAVLQAYSTKVQIERLGYEPVYVRPYGIKEAIALFCSDMGSFRPWNIKFLFQKNRKFTEAFKLFNEEKNKTSDFSKYKSVILGSDSIWVPNVGKTRMCSAYFGRVNCKRIGSYAASTGGVSDEKLYSDEQISALNNLSHYTVRDKVTQDFINRVVEKTSEIVLDPTLLIDWKRELDKNNIPYCNEFKGKKYIVVYGGMTEKMIESITKIAQQFNLEVYNVCSYDRRFKNNIPLSPFEFVRCLDNATLVVTSMFHGVMISISLKKKFIYYAKDNNRSIKLKTMMEVLGFDENDWIRDENSPISINGVNYPIDYVERLNSMRTHSLKEFRNLVEMEY